VRVNGRELHKAKENIRGKMALSLESSDDIAGFLAGQELSRGKIERPEEILARIDKVTSADIMRVAKETFVDEKLNLAMIGPVEDKKFLEKILRI
jgi:predicted Zn-dependent peptidase